ncbi:MAG: MBL fold metallo-hydrolase [Proteobacteria bacterium]|nr:MBL fold metallo-hydrolase [Pseudomonadota bacterium]MBU1594807.1 MBL fold metallo-hydrolase [Pseudomonadota bacterium]
MRKTLWMSGLLLLLVLPGLALAQGPKPVDSIPTDKGDLAVTFLGHGTLMFQWAGKVVHVDPWSSQADYAALPKADLILITHEHTDHLDGGAIKALRKDGTAIGSSLKASANLDGAVVLRNGESKELAGILVDAVPAYNRQHKRGSGEPYHPQGQGNGYVLHFGSVRVYVAGDTEAVPEMAALKGVDVAFLPVNLPYTMTTAMLAEAARMIQPRILYPYHTGDTDMAKAAALLADVPGVETRLRPMK